MSHQRIPFVITVQPWFCDHAVDGKIVFPAVETMLSLADSCLALFPETDVRVMADVRFGKFLEIPPTATTVAALIECASKPLDRRIQTKLLSHVQLGSMSRIKEHGEIFFLSTQPLSSLQTGKNPPPLQGVIKEIDTKVLYSELVPFGPFYQTLQGTLSLSENQAWGIVQAPDVPFIYPCQVVLGSPFPLDGALHAACVLGQQFVDFAPFPVGFARRIVCQPTQPGRTYATTVTLIALAPEELVFDLVISCKDGQIAEIVTGIRMRNVRKTVTAQPNKFA